MNNDTAIKIAMIKGSLRCFAFGMLGLLPFIGLPFAGLAMFHAGRVRVREKRFWNVAKPYRVWGTISGAIGAIVWGGIFAIFIGRAAWFAYVGD
jgi:hypothetical protein